ncbi:MAG: hypothetical protein RBR35_17405 [Salinivirgaceae bacterium]|nr:hypothetical protein [Salinivirgaceae bacterium]
MPRSRRYAKRLPLATLMLLTVALTGCGTVYLKGGESGKEIEKVDGGWLVSDKAMADLIECCQGNLDN